MLLLTLGAVRQAGPRGGAGGRPDDWRCCGRRRGSAPAPLAPVAGAARGARGACSMYGPTESTTLRHLAPIAAARMRRASIPIGRPIANTHGCYVLDRELQPVPPGCPASCASAAPAWPAATWAART